MERIFKNLLVLSVLLILGGDAYATGKAKKVTSFDWNPVINAIIQVESEGNPKAVSGNSCGAMQITPVLVKECNNILKKRKSKKRYSLSDRFNVKKSKEMFILFQSFYNKNNNVEQAIRSWNGGMNYSVRGTQKYYKKVMKHLK